MKNVLKDLIFIIIFVILLHICTNIFVLKGNTYGTDVTSFYKERNNSLDIIFFGSSHSYATFSPEQIKKETGLSSYNFATQQQPIYITYHYMIEALKTQHPKYFVLEIRMLAVDDNYASEGVNRDALDKMRLSLNKINAINTSVENKDERLSYYLNIIKYHSRYGELNKNDIIQGLTQKGINNKGFKSLEPNNEIIIDNSKILEIKDSTPITKRNLEYLHKIIDLAKENNIKLLLVKSPCELQEEDHKKYNWIEDFASNNNLEVINYNKKEKEINLEVGDYYDYGHLSSSGAYKVSKEFARYINERG